MTGGYGVVKRATDVVFAGAAITLLSPLVLIVAALVRIRLGSPVFFVQTRPGLHGVPFCMIKFRTMTDGRDGADDPLPDGQRLTPFGRWLRSTSLDELPELVNVLRGEMSLVGPRPLLLEYMPLYTPSQARRHEVRPGMTGWAQINGRNALDWEDKFALDIWYVDNRSFSLDLKILLRTLLNVLRRKDISATDEGTTPKFTGASS